MSFAANDAATLVRVPAGAFTVLEGRAVTVLARDTGATGRDRYTVTPLAPLSAAEQQALGVAGTLRMHVYAHQLRAPPALAVGDVATLLRVPAGAFALLEGRAVTVLAVSGRRYTVTPLAPLSAAEQQALGVEGPLQIEVYRRQLQQTQ